MQHRRRHSLLALSLVGALALAACGGDDDDADTASTDAPTTTPPPRPPTRRPRRPPRQQRRRPPVPTRPAPLRHDRSGRPGAAGAIADVCPETISLQTDWNPEAEHGFVYQLIGDGLHDRQGSASRSPGRSSPRMAPTPA